MNPEPEILNPEYYPDTMSHLVSVAVPIPFLPALTYRVPDGMHHPEPGSRVVVPLGSRIVTGCVIERDANTAGTPGIPDDGIRDVMECLDVEALVPSEVLELARWVADYYACGPGETIAAAMPPLAMAANRRHTPRFKTARVAHATGLGRDTSLADGGGGLGRRQREALALLVAAPDGLDAAVLRRRGVAAATLGRMERRGLVTLRTRRVDRDPFTAAEPGVTPGAAPPVQPTNDQRRALDTLEPLAESDRFQVALLHGVTGSGKTEVYLRLARRVCASGRRVLVLVPEIGLAPAVAMTFRRALGERVAIQHSGLSDGERHDQWHRIQSGAVDAVVGTRSAVFAPLTDIGLIVVDEEHDTSYKQEESPRYHARDVAVVRGQRAGALVVLGSATPSMESFHNAHLGRYTRVVMTTRVHKRPLATVQVVDMREVAAAEGPDVVLSQPFREALARALARGDQALIMLNRRGFASAVLCRQCGRTLECPNCSVTLTLHRGVGRARCHYCNYSVARPTMCSHCAGPYLETVGFGTERIEAELAERFPDATVGRLDRDTVGRRGAAAEILARFARGDIRVLVGTQMIAKGHDFPNVTLVGVVSADVGLTLADFRAAERTFQLLTQVAGRAGRGARPGEAIIQSFYPEHYSISYACRQEYEPFFDEEIRFRTDLRYPPVVAMVNAVVRGRSSQAAMNDARELAGLLRGQPGFLVLGPAPAPLARLRGQHRAQLFLKGDHRRAMRDAVVNALNVRPDLRRRVSVDVDPLSML